MKQNEKNSSQMMLQRLNVGEDCSDQRILVGVFEAEMTDPVPIGILVENQCRKNDEDKRGYLLCFIFC